MCNAGNPDKYSQTCKIINTKEKIKLYCCFANTQQNTIHSSQHFLWGKGCFHPHSDKLLPLNIFFSTILRRVAILEQIQMFSLKKKSL